MLRERGSAAANEFLAAHRDDLRARRRRLGTRRISRMANDPESSQAEQAEEENMSDFCT
jgi:hypothetical protein